MWLQLSERSTTPEGFDTSFATNVLGTTALTQRLLPALVAGAPSRVVFVSSGGMYTQPLCLKDLQHAKLQPWDGSAAYAKEKRCQVALAEHLAQAWADQGGFGGVWYGRHYDRNSSTHQQTSTSVLMPNSKCRQLVPVGLSQGNFTGCKMPAAPPCVCCAPCCRCECVQHAPWLG
jgi:hypothetical protein